MKQSDTTARFPQPFAAQADGSIVAYPLPTTKQANGRVSLLNGFPLENFTALSAGGVPPSGADFNGLFRTLTEAIRANEAGQIRAFNADYAQQIGGYPQSALVTDPANPTRLLLSTQDDNKTDPANDTSGAWMSLTDSISALDAAKLNRTGDTTSGNLVYQSDSGTDPWASTPQAIFRFENSKALGAVFGQIIGDGSFQTLLYSQNVDGVNKAWGFRSNDGHVATPNGHVLLEVDDTGDGHVIAQNIGSATGKTLATIDDTNAKLNRSGDIASGTLTFDVGNSYEPWSGSPQTQYKIGGGFASVWAQVGADNAMRLVLGANDPGQMYQSWQFVPQKRTITTPSGNSVMEAGNANGPRMRQCFRINLTNGNYISWPIPYARDELVVATFTCQGRPNQGGYSHVANYINGTVPDRYGVVVGVQVWDGAHLAPEGNPTTIDVTVEGYVA